VYSHRWLSGNGGPPERARQSLRAPTRSTIDGSNAIRVVGASEAGAGGGLEASVVESDATFKAPVDKFSERGVVDLTGTMGYYCFVSMMLNIDRYPLPDGDKPELKPLP
jgi:hypothetical protein